MRQIGRCFIIYSSPYTAAADGYFAPVYRDQSLKCAGSQRVEDPALSNVPGLFVYSYTVSPVAVIEWIAVYLWIEQ